MRPRRSPRDLSAQAGNLTSGLQQHASELWAMDDLESMQSAMLQLARQYVGHGLSEPNWRKFQQAVMGANTVDKLKFVLSSYILAGSGLGVTPRRESIDAIADAISESTEYVTEPRLLTELRRMFGELGYILVEA